MTDTPPSARPDDRKLEEDAWLDDTLAQSFPASDPLPQFHGEVKRQEPPPAAADSDSDCAP